MKTMIFAIALTLTSSAFAATTCFVRNTELNTQQVKLARELCFGPVELQLDVFSTSKALIRFSNDGNRAVKTVALNNGRDLGNGTLTFAFNIENNVAGGGCGDTWVATSTGTLIVKRDGSAASVTAVNAELSFSNDNCHSETRTEQSFKYDRL